MKKALIIFFFTTGVSEVGQINGITIDIAHGSARLSCHELKSKLAIYLFFELATTESWRPSGSVFRSVAQGLNLALLKSKAIDSGASGN